MYLYISLKLNPTISILINDKIVGVIKIIQTETCPRFFFGPFASINSTFNI